MACKTKRKKAFVGTIVNGVLGVANMINQNHMANKQMEFQERMQNRQLEMQQVAAMNQGLNNNNIQEEYQSRIGFRNGGKQHYTDRTRHIKRYSCGGRNRKK